MSTTPCSVCKGAKLKPEILAVTVGGLNIKELCDLAVDESKKFIENFYDYSGTMDVDLKVNNNGI